MLGLRRCTARAARRTKNTMVQASAAIGAPESHGSIMEERAGRPGEACGARREAHAQRLTRTRGEGPH